MPSNSENILKILKSTLDKCEPVAPGSRRMLRDTEVKGFGVRITSQSKAFFLEHRIKGYKLQTRITIGTYPAWTVEDARQRAREMIVEMDKGIDPREAYQRDEAKPVTLKDAYDAFMESRTMSEGSRANYERHFTNHLADWLKLPLSEITSEMVARRHIEISKVTVRNKVKRGGKSAANNVMRSLGSVFTFAQAKYGEKVVPKHPVKILAALRQWFPENARSNVIKRTQLGDWFKGIADLRKEGRILQADYLEFTLLTGARREEAASLKWDEVDFNERSIKFMQTKNGDDRTIPMTRYMEAMLKRRKEQSTGSEYVFASTMSKSGYISEPKYALATINDGHKVKVTMHDLRRTYATTLESLDVSVYALKTLLGHKMGKDVTGAHYTIIDIERLRPAAQRLEDTILRMAGIIEGNVLQYPKQA